MDDMSTPRPAEDVDRGWDAYLLGGILALVVGAMMTGGTRPTVGFLVALTGIALLIYGLMRRDRAKRDARGR